MQHVFWQANDLHLFLSLRNVLLSCDTNILYQDLLEDVANNFLEIVSCVKQQSNSVNVFICGILLGDDLSSVNCLLK